MRAEDLEKYYRLRKRQEELQEELLSVSMELKDFEERVLHKDDPTALLGPPKKPRYGLTPGDEAALRAAQGLGRFRVKELALVLEVSEAAVYQRMERLRQAGVINQVERGLYVVTEEGSV